MITNNNNNNNNNNHTNEKSMSSNQQECFKIWRSPFQNSVWTPAEEPVMVKIKLKGNVKVKLKEREILPCASLRTMP
jgi:hypothetical protein